MRWIDKALHNSWQMINAQQILAITVFNVFQVPFIEPSMPFSKSEEGCEESLHDRRGGTEGRIQWVVLNDNELRIFNNHVNCLLRNALAWKLLSWILLPGLLSLFFLNPFATCDFPAVIIIIPPTLPILLPHIFLDGEWKRRE